MRRAVKPESERPKKLVPAKTPEGRENQMIALAMEAAEEQMRKGTASSQVITHFLKLGSTREKKELAILEEEIHLIKARTKALHEAKDIRELYTQAIASWSKYSGNTIQVGENDYD